MKTALEVNNITKIFNGSLDGQTIVALKNINFKVYVNEFVTIVGPSGCGKTTLLNIIAGLIKPESGSISINNNTVKGTCTCRALVFQECALFPWKTALENIEFGLEIKGLQKDERKKIAEQKLKLVGLEGFGNCYPRQLSGGMKQKAQVARALALNPDILLLDEPFGSLDEITRLRLDSELLEIWEKEKKTVLLVTHSLEEALLLSDRIIMFSAHPGEIRYENRITELRPRDLFTPEIISLRKKLREQLMSCYQ
ncbi:MAG: ABC transporter ATP-binding protein [Desulfatiglans sp.]|jgi:NitT/TauT family transport system ATP-binding protein|nr:ABC transporter ATP-binding protein [Desulfatiglans sp.]